MRTCILTPEPLATDSRIFYQTVTLSEAGYRTTLLTPGVSEASPRLSYRGIETRQLHLGVGSTRRLSRKRFVLLAAARLADLRAEVIHAVGPLALEAAARAARRSRPSPRLVYDAPPEVERSRRDVMTEWHSLDRIALVLSARSGMARRFEMRRPAVPVQTVRTRFPRVELTPSLALPRRLGLGPEHSLIFVPWSAHAHVGLRSLAATLGRLPAGVHAVLGGYGNRRRDAETWVDRARAAGLHGRLHVAWFGSREEMVTWARGARLGCVAEIPSGPKNRHEAELPILHCLSAGLPVLVPDRSCDDREFTIAGDAVRRVDIADRWALRDAIGSLIGDPDALRQMALAARRAAETDCWEREAEAFLDAYRRHVGPPRVDRGTPRRRGRRCLELVHPGE